MKKITLALTLIVCFLCTLGSVHAETIKYEQFKPIYTMNFPVGDLKLRPSDPLQLKMLTWGGDYANVYANGGLETQPGSIMAQNGLNIKLVKQDDLIQQIKSYMSGETPFLRGTMGQIIQASGVTENDPRTQMVIFVQLSWSHGDYAVVRGKEFEKGRVLDLMKQIQTTRKIIASMQQYGPHAELFAEALRLSGADFKSTEIKWVKDLSADPNMKGNYPSKAMAQDKSIDMAFVITPDAATLTSGFKTGNGGDDSVSGAKVGFSTNDAPRIVADVIAVRSDFYNQNPETVNQLVNAIFRSNEQFADLYNANKGPQKSAEFTKAMKLMAKVFLDNENDTENAIALYQDCEIAGYGDNARFFGEDPRNMENVVKYVSESFIKMGLIQNVPKLRMANLNWDSIKKGLKNTSGVTPPKFNQVQMAKIAEQVAKSNDSGIMSFTVRFKAGEAKFDAQQYVGEFDKIIDLMTTFAGSAIAVEGHMDPYAYVSARIRGVQPDKLQMVRQQQYNLTRQRAVAIVDAIMKYAESNGTTLDRQQFVIVGKGFSNPVQYNECLNASSLTPDLVAEKCDIKNPKPGTEKQWPDNMRAVFSIQAVNLESF